MRKTSKTLAIVACAALLWTPVAQAATAPAGSGPGQDGAGPGLVHWLQEVAAFLPGWSTASPDRTAAAGKAEGTGSTGSTDEGDLGDPTTQVDVTIDPDG